MSPRTLAIIGLGGRISGVAANVLARTKNLRLVGYADPGPIGAENLRKKGIDPGQGFTDHEAMLATLKPDHVMIGSPNHLHLTHITAALQSGAHVFSEKPVVITPEETWAAADLLKRHGQERFLVGLVLRSSPLFRAVHGAIAAGAIGRPVSMEANELLTPEHGGFIARDWRRFRKYSGSHILEKCCHDLDLHQAVLGSRIVRAASFGGQAIFTPENRGLMDAGADEKRYRKWGDGWRDAAAADPFTSGSEVLDHQVVIAECENGARLSFHLNNHSPFGQRRWVVCGVTGAIESDFATGKVRCQAVYGESRDLLQPGKGEDGHYGADTAMAQDLVDAWFHGKPFPVPTKAALEAGLAAMLIDRAQIEGRVADGAAELAKLDRLLLASAAA